MTDNLTWYGGGPDSYVQNLGLPIGGATCDVWDTTTPGTGTRLTDLRQYDAQGVLQTVTQVKADALGYFRYAVNNFKGPTFVDPGLAGLTYRFQVNPNNLHDRITALEAVFFGAPAAAVDHGVWTAGTTFSRGDYFTSPTTGERRYVAVSFISTAPYDSDDLANTIPTSSGTASALTSTGVKAADYAAAGGDFALIDATAANRIVNLPVAPTNRSQVAVKAVALTAGNTVTVQVTGAVRFNLASGSTTALTLTQPNQVVLLQYDATGSGVWLVLSDSVPLSALDARFAPASWSQQAADLRYSPLGAYLKEIAVWTGDLLFRGMDEDPNGVDILAAGSIHQLDAVLDLPAEGQAIIVNVYKLTAATGAEAQIGTVTIPAGTVHGSFTYTGSTGATPDVAIADGDKIFARLSQVGSTFPGAGLKLRMALGGRTFPTLAAPGVPTGFGVIASDANSATLAWANGTNSTQNILYRSDANGNLVPYWNLGSVTSFVDKGPDGTGLAPGEVHQYAIKARRASEVSALSASVSAGAVSYTAWVKADGSLDTTAVTPTVGAGGSAGQGISTVVQNTANATLLKGGNSASNFAAADRVLLKGIIPAGLHSGWAVNTLFSPFNASSSFEWYIGSDDQNLSGTNPTNYLRFSSSVSNLAIGGKFGAWVPTSTTGQGTTSSSFQNITDPAYPVNLLGTTTRTSANGLPYGFTLQSTTKYGLRIEAQPPTGSGTGAGSTQQQVYVVRFGTEAQYGVKGATAASMPTFVTMTVPADRQQSRLPGFVFFQQQGVSAAAGVAGGVYVYDFQVAALTAAGA